MLIARDRAIIASVVGVLLLLFLWFALHTHELGEERFRQFYRAEVTGRIQKLEPAKGAFMWNPLEKRGNGWFYPAVPKGEDYHGFGAVANKGD